MEAHEATKTKMEGGIACRLGLGLRRLAGYVIFL